VKNITHYLKTLEGILRITSRSLQNIFLPKKILAMIYGHRGAVGGEETWHELGKWQYHFLVSEGLLADHILLDAGCGSLRLGQFIIPYLAPKKYYGFDRESYFLERGKDELYLDIFEKKLPTLILSENFDIEKVEVFDFCIAQSLVSHLNEVDAIKLFKAIIGRAKSTSIFLFSYCELDAEKANVDGLQKPLLDFNVSSNWRLFFYTRKKMEEMLNSCGWQCDYIGSPKDYTPGQKWFRCTNKQ